MFHNRRPVTFAGLSPASSSKANGFTLVELLVVIGIIATLISILLPALNKARQEANLIGCQANLRTMGQALSIYISETKGYLPYGEIATGQSWESGPPPSNDFAWFWMFTLSQYMNRNILGSDGLVHNLSPVFRDYDTIPDSNANYVSHYTCNPRLFPSNFLENGGDQLPAVFSGGSAPAIPNSLIHPPNLTAIKTPSVFLIWCAPQCAAYPTSGGNLAFPVALALDSFQYSDDYCFVLGTPDTGVNYNRPVNPGEQPPNQIAVNTWKNQFTYNEDTTLYDISLTEHPNYEDTQIRFRHLENTTLNALCLDGHVESRREGSFMVNDICINYPQQ